MKSEGGEALELAVETLLGVVSLQGFREEFSVLMGLALRYIKSTSLPLRLVGWGYMDSSCRKADDNRSLVTTFEISGASVAAANGVYELENPKESKWRRVDPDTGFQLTLERCA